MYVLWCLQQILFITGHISEYFFAVVNIKSYLSLPLSIFHFLLLYFPLHHILEEECWTFLLHNIYLITVNKTYWTHVKSLVTLQITHCVTPEDAHFLFNLSNQQTVTNSDHPKKCWTSNLINIRPVVNRSTLNNRHCNTFTRVLFVQVTLILIKDTEITFYCIIYVNVSWGLSCLCMKQ